MFVTIVPPGLSSSPSAPLKPYGYRRTWLEFIDDVKSRIEPFVGRRQSEETRGGLAASIASAFAEAEAAGEVFEIAEGMRVVGGSVRFELDQGTMVWRTAFTRGARWNGQAGATQPLGYFGEYDLYIGFQGALPPTLIARYGYRGEDYLTFNPALQLGENVAPHGGVFQAALDRATFTGVDLQFRA